MPFFTIYVKATGEHYSGTSERKLLAQPMPAHLDFKEHADPPDFLKEMWDTTALAWVPRPVAPPTRLEELRARPPTGGSSGRYTDAERDGILNLMIGGNG